MTFTSDEASAGVRLDAWLMECDLDLSRSRIQSLIRDGYVTVDGKAVRKNLRMSPGRTVEVELPPVESSDLVAEDIPLDVLLEDEAFVVINKPPGLVVHPAAGHSSGTLVNALLHRYPELPDIGGERRPGIVHRLDKDTSGVLVVAKGEQALANLMKQFQDRTVAKRYQALVWGVPDPPEGTIETKIGRSRHERKKMTTRPTRGRQAVTRYTIQEAFDRVALLRVVIETGRTHQIRVHLTHIGHPVIGDAMYGRPRRGHPLEDVATRQMLHADRLRFAHPVDGRMIEVKCQPAADMADIITRLREG